MKKLLVLVLVMCLTSFASAQLLSEYNFDEIGLSADDTTADAGVRNIAGTIHGWATIIEDDGTLAALSSTFGSAQAGGGVINFEGPGTGEWVGVSGPGGDNLIWSGDGAISRTIGGWFKATDPAQLKNGGWSGLIGASGNWSLLAGGWGADRIRASFEYGGAIDTGTYSPLADGQWHHIALVNNIAAVGGFQKLYFDGLLYAEIATTNTNQADWGAAAIGNDLEGTGAWGERCFLGQADAVFFTDTALTQAEVQAQAGIPEPTTIALLGLGLALLRRKNS